MKAMKIVLAALAALMVLGGLGMASTVGTTVTLDVPSYISVSVASSVPLTNDVETHIASGSDSMVISSTNTYYVQGAAPLLTTGSSNLAEGLHVSTDAGAHTTDLYGTADGGATPGETPRDIENLGTSASKKNPVTSLNVPLAYTQDTEDIAYGAYTTTVTYTVTLTT